MKKFPCWYKNELIIILKMKIRARLGLVTGDGAWQENREYKYKLVSKIFVRLPGGDDQHGHISNVHLTIRPQARGMLLAQITQAGYAAVDDQESKEERSGESFAYYAHQQPKSGMKDALDATMRKPFIIQMRNGAVHSLSVDNAMTTEQVNQLKFIVSQFQVDTKGQLAQNREGNHLPNANSNNGLYVVMEPTVTGECETTYDVSPLPDYLAKSQQDSIPMPQLVGDGHIIKIVKTKNHDKCEEKTRYLTDFAGNMNDENRMYGIKGVSEISQIFVTGTLNNYTIQSVATARHGNGLSEYIYLELESVDTINSARMLNLRRSSNNYKNINSLVHKEVSHMQQSRNGETELTDRQVARAAQLRSVSRSLSRSESSTVDKWSGCWTAFVGRESICKNEFSAEWTPVGGTCCGLFCAGINALCRRSYPGCEATVCYSAFISHEAQCASQFGDRLPVASGGFTDCAPGFWATRCCPKSN
ncbi:Vitellogenin-A1 [Pseudolycoriella hygida]|uniref:Vitellogenin-A1 n=1 Tax=Pseudolycoriella hygida TaxID=35572 RepID=A0A9Q0NDK6_9DIPT|nr:Vitellogenin-A1 [Pseudolycoriella hygida]